MCLLIRYMQMFFCFFLFPQGRSKVVVVKYAKKPLSNQTLFSLAEMFGNLREHLVLDKKVDKLAPQFMECGILNVARTAFCCLQ